jgi:predicted Zn-dependent protease
MIRKLLKLGAALGVVALTAWGALALNVDQTRNTVARQNLSLQTSYYRVTVNFNDANISTPQKFGRLLQNAFLSNVACHVTTVFNAGTTNVLTMGTVTTSGGDIIDAATSTKSINEASATYQQITQAGSLGVSVTSDADHDLWVRYVQTGTAATAGAATCVIEFIPNNDL